MSTIYICEDTEHDMDPFLAVDRDGILSGLENLCGGHYDSIYEPSDGVMEIYWADDLGNNFTVRCFPQTLIYGDKKALDQLEMA